MNVSMEKHNANLATVDGLLTDEKKCAVAIAPDQTEIQRILDEQKKKTKEAFKVLIVGAFNAGKSSMINALAGREEFLPTGDLPETGVITELIYGEQYRITLYPKEGSGSSQPVVLTNPSADAFRQYCSIDNKASMEGEKTQNMTYERVVVECDIPLLKEGIMLIDTVGMNDPWGNDYITERYFPKADAVIYLMTCDQPYNAEDVKLLTRINSFGFRDLIIVYTKYGQMRQRNRRRPQSYLDEFCEVCRQHAAKHTDIGDQGIHFIDSIDGLDGKLDGDREAVIRSGIAGLEEFYTRYLIENKGRMKIQTLNRTMQKLSDELSSVAAKTEVGATTDIGEIKARISKANQELAIAEQEAEANVVRFERVVQKNRALLEESIKVHIASLADQVDLDGYTLQTSLPRGIAKLVPGSENKKAEEIQKECQAELNRRMNAANKEWIATKLNEQITAMIQTSVEGIGQELLNFYVRMDEVDDILEGKRNSEKKKTTLADVLSGVAFTVLTGDPVTGSLAITHGKAALGRGIAANVVANAGLGLAAAAGMAVSLPLVIGVYAVAQIAAILMSNPEKREQKIMSDVVKKHREAYRASPGSIEDTVAGLLSVCDEQFRKASDNLRSALRMELDKKRSETRAMLDVAQKGVGEKEQVIQRNAEAVKLLEEIRETGDAIAAQYN